MHRRPLLQVTPTFGGGASPKTALPSCPARFGGEDMNKENVSSGARCAAVPQLLSFNPRASHMGLPVEARNPRSSADNDGHIGLAHQGAVPKSADIVHEGRQLLVQPEVHPKLSPARRPGATLLALPSAPHVPHRDAHGRPASAARTGGPSFEGRFGTSLTDRLDGEQASAYGQSRLPFAQAPAGAARSGSAAEAAAAPAPQPERHQVRERIEQPASDVAFDGTRLRPTTALHPSHQGVFAKYRFFKWVCARPLLAGGGGG